MNTNTTEIKPNYSRIAYFLIALFTISLFLIGSFMYFDGDPQTRPGAALNIIYSIIPLIIVICIHQFVYREPLLRSVEVGDPYSIWSLIPIFGVPAFTLLCLVGAQLYPNIMVDTENYLIFKQYEIFLSNEFTITTEALLRKSGVPSILFNLVQAIILGLSINLIFSFSEEMGWRGFMLRELSPLGFTKCVFIIGGIWALWYAPLIWMNTQNLNYVLINTFYFMLLSPIYIALKYLSKSLIAVSLMHSMLSAFASFSMLSYQKTAYFMNPFFQLSILFLVLFNISIWAYHFFILPNGIQLFVYEDEETKRANRSKERINLLKLPKNNLK